MSIAEFVLISGDFVGEWVETPTCWKWRSFTKVTIPVAVRRNSSYNELVPRVMQSGDLDCTSDNVVVSYLINLREKVNPTIINSDVRVLMYMIDVDADGFRTILRINVAERHISIANAFSRVYRCAHHGLCMRHLAKNLKHLIELKNKIPKAAHVLENVLSFEKWSRAYFPGNRYDVMTTNITESLNSVLMDEREYPMSYILNSIIRKFGEKFRERHTFVAGQNNKFVSCAERILRDNKSVSDFLYVTNENGGLNQFMVFSNDVAVKVSLLERSCSCQKFNLVKMLSEHAMADLQAKYGDDIGYGNSIYEYSLPIYKAENYLLAY
ncbi:hypothetical protein T459_25628 [Capsicum annuum]|uniref:MULE transposase domain-containing protein n=1 Tax=Capsicum annuum TaxID=4072 RepID=A0A2G2YLC7_CAPAN|nr:hypothetical protein T459_25628 [Capsicum annuum]